MDYDLWHLQEENTAFVKIAVLQGHVLGGIYVHYARPYVRVMTALHGTAKPAINGKLTRRLHSCHSRTQAGSKCITMLRKDRTLLSSCFSVLVQSSDLFISPLAAAAARIMETGHY